jgi:hypothetical protein
MHNNLRQARYISSFVKMCDFKLGVVIFYSHSRTTNRGEKKQGVYYSEANINI